MVICSVAVNVVNLHTIRSRADKRLRNESMDKIWPTPDGDTHVVSMVAAKAPMVSPGTTGALDHDGPIFPYCHSQCRMFLN